MTVRDGQTRPARLLASGQRMGALAWASPVSPRARKWAAPVRAAGATRVPGRGRFQLGRLGRHSQAGSPRRGTRSTGGLWSLRFATARCRLWLGATCRVAVFFPSARHYWQRWGYTTLSYPVITSIGILPIKPAQRRSPALRLRSCAHNSGNRCVKFT